jgi:multidrug efflux pump subunit AcrA (membrane-fusion protein)
MLHRTIELALLVSALWAAPALAQTTARVVVPPPPPVTARPATVSVPAASVSTAAAHPGAVVTPTAETDSEIRQREAVARIDAATRTGLIDAGERAHLDRALARLQAYQERCYADGLLTLREQARLARYHARLDRAITRAIAR